MQCLRDTTKDERTLCAISSESNPVRVEAGYNGAQAASSQARVGASTRGPIIAATRA